MSGPAPFTIPRVDEYAYRLVTLDNGIQALLVHDPTTDKAAAACDVSEEPNIFASRHGVLAAAATAAPTHSPCPTPRSAPLHPQVRVGSLSDPSDVPGLAHFVEHMLFYSSEKYQEEDAYSKFIQEHGGHTNAYTANESTNYHFDVNWSYEGTISISEHAPLKNTRKRLSLLHQHQPGRGGSGGSFIVL